MIKVTRTGDAEFEVVVGDDPDATRHVVTSTPATLRRLSSDYPPDVVIEASFRFLLEREPRESILRQFDLMTIARYFPEFEAELPHYLGDSPARR